MDEADRREQLRAAVRAAKQEVWENAVELASDRPSQPAPSARSRESIQRAENYDQGYLIREDWLSKEDITELAINLTAAGAVAVDIPYAEELHQAVERSTPGGIDDIQLLAQNASMRIQQLKQAAQRAQKWIGNQMEERRYPAQRNEQDPAERKAEPVTRMCSLNHGAPATRIIGQIELEGHETMMDVALCDRHGQALYNAVHRTDGRPAHELDEFRDAGGSKELLEKLEPYVKDTNTKLLHARRPERPREPHEIERSLGLERDRGSEGRTL